MKSLQNHNSRHRSWLNAIYYDRSLGESDLIETALALKIPQHYLLLKPLHDGKYSGVWELTVKRKYIKEVYKNPYNTFS